MDRGAWWATVHGVTRVRHDLATKPSPYARHSIHISGIDLAPNFIFNIYPPNDNSEEESELLNHSTPCYFLNEC